MYLSTGRLQLGGVGRRMCQCEHLIGEENVGFLPRAEEAFSEDLWSE